MHNYISIGLQLTSAQKWCCSKFYKFHVYQCQAQIEIWRAPDIPLTLTWHSPDTHLNLNWPPEPQLTIIWPSPDAYLMFTWRLPDHLTIIWPSPDLYLTLISSYKLNKYHVHQCQAQNTLEIWPDIHLTFNWPHLTIIWPSPDPYLNLNVRLGPSPDLTWPSPEVHLTFTWPPDHHLTIS